MSSLRLSLLEGGGPTQRQPSGGLWTAFIIVTLAALYTHYYSALVILVEDAFLLLYWCRYRHLR